MAPDRTVGKVIPLSFIAFIVVGSVGVGVYFGIFTLALFIIRTSFDVAQMAATGTAMSANFFLHNTITFRSARLRGRRIIAGLVSFCAACSVGMWMNLKMAHIAGQFGAEWYTAGLLGLSAGAIWNYGVTQVFTWRRGRKSAAIDNFLRTLLGRGTSSFRTALP